MGVYEPLKVVPKNVYDFTNDTFIENTGIIKIFLKIMELFLFLSIAIFLLHYLISIRNRLINSYTIFEGFN